MDEDRTLLKIMMKSGQVIQLYADEHSIADLFRQPRFIPMASNDNQIMVSLEDIIAFEILPQAETLQPTDDDNAEASSTTSA